MKCHSVRSECQKHLLKCAPRCHSPLIQNSCALSAQQCCFYFWQTASEMRSLSISKNVRQTAAKWTRVKVGLRPHLTGDWWEQTLRQGSCSQWGILLGTISGHLFLIYTHRPLFKQKQICTPFLLVFMSLRFRFWTSSVWVVWCCIRRCAKWRQQSWWTIALGVQKR